MFLLQRDNPSLNTKCVRRLEEALEDILVLVASKSNRFNLRWDIVVGTVTRLGGSNPVRGKKFPLLQSVQPPIRWYCGMSPPPPPEGAKTAGE